MVMIDLHDLHDVRGRERRRLTQKFPPRTFRWEHGLRDQLFAQCGGQNDYGLAIGRVLLYHSCGIWGPVPRVDRQINQFVLERWLRAEPCGRWVISQHMVAGVKVEIATDLITGETRMRRPTSPLPRRCDEVGE